MNSMTQEISADQFCRDFARLAITAREDGPIAVTAKSKVVGYFLGPEEYEALYGLAVRNLLKSRMEGKTISQSEARRRIERAIKRGSQRP